MVKHDSMDKAPLNDEALRRPQKLYGASRFTSHKVYFCHVPEHRSCEVDAGLLCNKTAVGNCVLYTYNL